MKEIISGIHVKLSLIIILNKNMFSKKRQSAGFQHLGVKLFHMMMKFATFYHPITPTELFRKQMLINFSGKYYSF